jgi:hypothetical protein
MVDDQELEARGTEWERRRTAFMQRRGTSCSRSGCSWALQPGFGLPLWFGGSSGCAEIANGGSGSRKPCLRRAILLGRL